MSSYKVEQLKESVMCLKGKNLFYSHDKNTLMWCDVLGGQVFSMDLSNHNMLSMFKIVGENLISFSIPIEGKNDQYIVGAGNRLLLVTWDGIHTIGHVTKVLAEVSGDGIRMNQCKVDKMGRLYFGTMISEHKGEVFNFEKRVGSLYRFSSSDGLVKIKDDIGVANGIAWNNSWNKMYFVDSYDLAICEFDYDVNTGDISNQKVFIDVSKYCPGKRIFPSALMVDQDDHLYLTVFGGATILRINTDSRKVVQEIKMNVKTVSGCEFGGKDLDTLYVSSTAYYANNPQVYPAGFMMKVTGLGCKGLKMHKFVLN